MSKLIDTSEQTETDRAYYRRIAAEYSQRHQQPIQAYTTLVETRWLREMLDPGSRVLVVGAGGGRELAVMLDLDCRITALDYSEEMLDLGRQLWTDDRITWVLGDVHDLHKHRKSYDATISLAAVNNFIDVTRAFSEMAQSLIEGGRLIVSSVNSLHRSERQVSVQPSPSKVTRSLYSPEDMKRIAREADMTIEQVRGMRFWCDLLPPAWNTSRASRWQRGILKAELAVEPILQRLLRPHQAKFFWLVARR